MEVSDAFMLPIGRRGCIWNLLFICLNKEEKHLGTAYTHMEGSEKSDRWILKVWCRVPILILQLPLR